MERVQRVPHPLSAHVANMCQTLSVAITTCLAFRYFPYPSCKARTEPAAGGNCNRSRSHRSVCIHIRPPPFHHEDWRDRNPHGGPYAEIEIEALAIIAVFSFTFTSRFQSPLSNVECLFISGHEQTQGPSQHWRGGKWGGGALRFLFPSTVAEPLFLHVLYSFGRRGG